MRLTPALQRFARLTALLITAMSLMSGSALAAEAAPTLTDIEASGTPASTRLILDFNRIPNYRLKTLGQKVEIRLFDTTYGAGIRRLPEDDKIVKVLLARDRKSLVVSCLLRRMPGNVVATPDIRLHRLYIDIRWEQESGVRPAIVFDLPGMPRFRKKGVELKPTGAAHSVWSGNWRGFLRASHTPVFIEVQPAWTFPYLSPPTSLDDSWRNAYAKADWQGLSTLPQKDLGEAEQLALFEAFIRLGRYEDAERENLVLQQHEQLNDPNRRLYLQAQLQLRTARIFDARVSLDRMENPTEDLRLLATLLKAETALALDRPQEATGILQTIDVPLTRGLAQKLELRRIDTLVLAGKNEEAVAAYQKLGPELDRSPFSLALLAAAAQRAHRPDVAGMAFDKLSRLPDLPRDQKLLARFAALTINRTPQQIITAFDELQQIRWLEPDSEAARRVVLRLTDIMAPADNPTGLENQLADYLEIAEQATRFDLRLEAALKAAVLLHLTKNDRAAVEQLEKILRQFHRGRLREDAVALLTEILPDTINGYLADGKAVKALALVERHRNLLIQQYMSWDFLSTIARAFNDLELLERANRIFLFLYDRVENRQRKGEACLALAQNYQRLGEPELTVEYAQRAAKLLKGHRDRNRAITLELVARSRLESAEAALTWLEKRTDLPDNTEGLRAAADLYWQTGNYERAAELLQTLENREELAPAEKLRLAEACYRAGRIKLALKHFRQLVKQKLFTGQANYRIGCLLLRQDRIDEGSRLLRQVAESASSTNLWKKLAAERLRELTL
ncbi:hypothetical protein EDC39_101378 [Geothermobacter ehrlichii]|uniref:Uncharacterized protein n=1 Tax=Geothermobacter ehrlichii TaxID=213224 RepID=A0A5D3WPS1_9BACT|nr:hypothetical protein [Geothermobacter ehrlichii]TYP00217.1 hypothetical protein EDC39_101378 [Geothermobacter ehrlichii]